jgi:transcriptional regulator with XRE-family HTH domain
MPGSPGESSQPPSHFASWVEAVVPAIFASDSALARAAGVNRSTASRWRHGATPDLEALRALAEPSGTSFRTLRLIAGYPPEDPS